MAASQRLVCKNCRSFLMRVDVLRAVPPGAEVEFRVDCRCRQCDRDNVYDLFLKVPVKKNVPIRSAHHDTTGGITSLTRVD